MKTCSLLIALISLKCTLGQIAYRPIPETQATWIQANFLYGGFYEHETTTSAIYTLNDTVINGLPYVRFGTHGFRKWINGYGNPNQVTGSDTIPFAIGYFRQNISQKKVYLWNPATQEDLLLYDFENLIVGQPYPETSTNINYPHLLVMAQDSVQLIDGNYYKRWVLGTNSSDSAYVSVIEGVGGTNGFTAPIYPVFEHESVLLCQQTGTQSIYENWQTSIIPPVYAADCSKTLSLEEQKETAGWVFPNPSSAEITVQASQLIRSVEVFDLKSQLVHHEKNSLGTVLSMNLSHLNKGVYFIRITLSDEHTIMKQIQLI